MTDNNLKIISVSLEPALHATMQDACMVLGYKQGKRANVSRLVRELVVRYIDSMVSQKPDPEPAKAPDDSIRVILDIPTDLRNDADKLKQWLSVKTEAIAKALG
jgi:hypothetical protein